MSTSKIPSSVRPLARAGLIAKGVVYCLLGVLAFMSAFEIGGQTNDKVDKKGVFEIVEGTGGKLLLGLLAAGLLCYTIWRIVHAFYIGKGEGEKGKKTSKIIRYVFSGLVYLSLSVYAIKRLLGNGDNGKDNTHETVSNLMQKPFGQWMVGLLGVIIAITGIYQVYYALSEKYKKHVDGLNLHSTASKNLLFAGKTGYIARGLVWLILSWLLLRAAFHANSNEAGDTSKAFDFLEHASYGSYMLGLLGLGVICYGVFNFVRARYERF